MRIPVMAGNWKMNQLSKDIVPYFNALQPHPQCEVMIAAPALYLDQCVESSRKKNCRILSQDVHHEEKGAFTGNISYSMLKDLHVHGSLVGHSERRTYHGETNNDVRRKTQTLLANDLYAIVCVGETLEQRKANQTLQVIQEQVEAVQDLWTSKLLVAYEPVWAIGTGESATPDDVQIVHKHIRQLLGENGHQTRILYGGSVKPENIKPLLELEDVDGALVGGASLDANIFQQLINACK